MSKDLAALARMFHGLPAVLEKNVGYAVKMAADDAANRAREHHKYKDRSGALTNSIDADGPMGALMSGGVEAVLSAGAPYAEYVEKGTRPHKIKPRYRKSLRFPAKGGGWAFAGEVNHPGTSPTLFLQDAADAAVEKLESELVPDAVELSFSQIGFDRA